MKLLVSIVTYDPVVGVLRQTLDSLGSAIRQLNIAPHQEAVAVRLVDNGPGAGPRRVLEDLAAACTRDQSLDIAIVTTGGNPGFGAGNNFALLHEQAEYNLVLNPDVVLETDALAEAIPFMDARPEVGLLAPAVLDAGGAAGHLCKRYPSVLVLFLRGFAPRWLRAPFRSRLARYACEDYDTREVQWDVPIVSGSFMLCRGELFRRAGGFDDRFFLYFEDFDLSLRLGKLASNVYCPHVRIRHHGGGAARKGWRHVGYFMVSAGRFFRKHGWKWY